MKNILKIFTALLLTLNVMPVLSADNTSSPNISVNTNTSSNTNVSLQTQLNTMLFDSGIAPNEFKLKKQKINFNPGGYDAKAAITSGTPDIATQRANEAMSKALATKPNPAPAKNAQNENSQSNPTGTGTELSEQNLSTVNTDSLSSDADANETDSLEEKQQAYDNAKAKEQSMENKSTTALSTAATGIGGMELAQGLAEQKADKAAAEDMAAYINTMRCTYGKGKSVKAGSEEIELPGGNSDELMKLRNEYFALASDLKARKEALGMKPGIESEEILDKAQLDLYSQENVGITDGAYASLYRSQMLGAEKDKSQIDEDAKKSKNRVIGGGVAAGVGVVGGAVGDSLINGKLHDIIEDNKNSDDD